ncbi:MAG: hypothetical protein JNL71_18705 [Rhodospirillales bacterium]|nr:hypothetical protein [Rhodospirillales bacterium]
MTRFVGITIFPEFFQNEGVEAALDNLVDRAGATAIATSPYVMMPAPDGTGSREPPADAGAGKVRLLDRPLWGRRELFVRTSPSFVPDAALYKGLRYRPPSADELTAAQGPVIADSIRAAKARGLEVYLQIQAAIPPGYRVQFGGPEEDDRPRLPDGSSPAVRVDNNASLASPHIRAYARALVRDLVGTYPEIDGLRVDWPEYPPYSLDGAFFDFGTHAEAAAARLEFDFGAMRAAAAELRTHLLGGLTAGDLAAWASGKLPVEMLFGDTPGLAAWLRFKAVLSNEIIRTFREALDDAGAGHMKLVPNAFPPPWTHLSGLDFDALDGVCDGVSVKLYTMHWPMMVRAWADTIAAANPNLASDPNLGRGIARLFGIGDGPGPARLADWRYPEPEEMHPVGAMAQTAKIEAARHAAGRVPVYALAHGYGPVADFEERCRIAWNASGGQIWVNRYGYLADAKLDAIGRVSRLA